MRGRRRRDGSAPTARTPASAKTPTTTPSAAPRSRLARATARGPRQTTTVASRPRAMRPRRLRADAGPATRRRRARTRTPAITLFSAIHAKLVTYRTTATSARAGDAERRRAAMIDGTRSRGPSGASAATSAAPATLPTTMSVRAVRSENDDRPGSRRPASSPRCWRRRRSGRGRWAAACARAQRRRRGGRGPWWGILPPCANITPSVSPRTRIPQPTPGRLDEAGIVEAFAHRMMYSVAKDEYTASPFDVYHALAYAVRDRLMERWFQTQSAYYRATPSASTTSRSSSCWAAPSSHNIVNLGARGAYTEALAQPGLRPRGAPRSRSGTRASATAAWAGSRPASWTRRRPWAFPSTATASATSTASSSSGSWTAARSRSPDNWLRYGNPWEIPRPDAVFPVRFYGRTEHAPGRGRRPPA